MTTPPDPAQPDDQPPQGYPPQGYPQPGYPQPGYPQHGYPGADQRNDPTLQPYPGQAPAGPYGQPQPQQPYPQQPYPGGPQAGGVPAQYPYPYPYGTQYPAPTQDQFGLLPVAKPPTMHIALVLLILSAALPGIFFGLLLALSFSSNVDVNLDTAAKLANITVSQLLGVLRVAATILVVLAILYIVFSVLAYRGRNWARITVTVMTIIFDLFLLYALIGGQSNAGGMAVVGGVIVASVVGVVLLYLRPSAEYFAASAVPRRM